MSTTVKVDHASCVGCSSCVEICPERGFSVRNGRAVRRAEPECSACGVCADRCPANAVMLPRSA